MWAVYRENSARQARRFAFLLLLPLAVAVAAPGTAPQIDVLTVDGAIGPASSEYIEDGLKDAAEQHAAAVVLKLDTPGGLASSMRDIIKAILASPVPVIGYVAPSGARAASAGTYILYATHIAAMAPATNLGAATPVPLMGSEPAPGAQNGKQAQPQMSAEDRKVLNDSVAYIRGLAKKRGRNADWAEKAVREAASLPADTALEKHVVDLIAPSLQALLTAVDGRAVELPQGIVKLHTANAQVRTIEPDWRIKLLEVITDPTLAYLLFLGGIAGLAIEATHPGVIFPGAAGAICLFLGLFGFGILPVNYAGLALILLGIGMMAAEAFIASFGTLGIGGIVAFVAGSIILMNTNAPGFSVSLWAIGGISFAASVCLLALIFFALRSHRRPIVSGEARMIGATVVAQQAFSDAGLVRFEGEIWNARSSVPVAAGETLKIVAVDGLTLKVAPLNNSAGG